MYRRVAIEVYYSTGDSLETADKLVLIEGDKFHVPVETETPDGETQGHRTL